MAGPDKKKIQGMFDGIAPDYDKLNHIMSLNIDKRWRRRALKEILPKSHYGTLRILDIACGTGDFSIAMARSLRDRKYDGLIDAADISEGMLSVMRGKVGESGIGRFISIKTGDGENLEYSDATFDRVTNAFGIRNFQNREKGLSEMLRVLKPGGKLVILELAIPQNSFVRSVYKLYFLHIMPFVGGLVSGDRKAYRYLPASVVAFPAPDAFCGTMKACGFTKVRHKSFTLGLCQMFVGEKA